MDLKKLHKRLTKDIRDQVDCINFRCEFPRTMKITQTAIYKLTIPMEPFVIATETSYYAQNTFIRIHTDSGLTGVGECSAFPMLVGETQQTCYEVAKDFARILRDKDPLEIDKIYTLLGGGAANLSGTRTDGSAHNFMRAASGIEMALWDLLGKLDGKSLREMFGGVRERVDVGVSVELQDTTAELVKTVEK